MPNSLNFPASPDCRDSTLSHNPYDLDLESLNALIQAVDLRIRESRDQCAYYDPANAPVREQAVRDAEAKALDASSQVQVCIKQMHKLDAARTQAECALEANKWSVKSILDGTTALLKRACKTSMKASVENFQHLQEAQAAEALAHQFVSACQEKLAIFREQSPFHIEYGEALAYHENEKISLLDAKEVIVSRKEALDHDLRSVVSELDLLRSNMNLLKRNISTAERLEAKLSAATDSHQRRAIHNESQQSLNDSAPRKVIERCQKELRRLDSSYQKINRRVNDIVKRHTMKVEGLVIDGSNLCYMQSDFIGASAVVAVADHLALKYPVTVVFDASIRRKLGMGHDEIRTLFSDKVKVHVVASKTKADSLVLKEAATPNYWVISNDRFVEFMTEPAVAENRTIRHEITDNGIYVEQLNVQIPLVFPRASPMRPPTSKSTS